MDEERLPQDKLIKNILSLKFNYLTYDDLKRSMLKYVTDAYKNGLEDGLNNNKKEDLKWNK